MGSLFWTSWIVSSFTSTSNIGTVEMKTFQFKPLEELYMLDERPLKLEVSKAMRFACDNELSDDLADKINEYVDTIDSIIELGD